MEGHAMPDLGLSLEELVQAVKACAWVRWGKRTPPVLQEFIACRLSRSHPSLSDKVRRLDRSRMESLARLIRTVQSEE
jgi:hypothetical protein